MDGNEVHGDMGDLYVGGQADAHCGDAGHHGMSASGEESQHTDGVGTVERFGEDFAVKDDAGVSCEHRNRLRISLMESGDGLGFLDGEPLDISSGRFVRKGVFVDLRRFDREAEASLGEEFAAAGGGGGENEHEGEYVRKL